MAPSAPDRGTGSGKSAPEPEREADVLKAAVDVLRERLPASWSLQQEQPEGQRDVAVDAVLRITADNAREVVVLLQVKRLLNTRDVPAGLDGLRRAASRWGQPQDVVPVLAARYLAPATRERIAELGGGYVDATGNLLLSADDPALFLRDRGADRDPWRGPGRPRGTLRGEPAARVVRALADFAPPYSVPELVASSAASKGATYRVVEFLEGEGLLDRQRYGPITDVRWRRLLERWSQDYGFASSNTVATYLEPRGLTVLTDRLKQTRGLGYVVTGSLAAGLIAPYAPARLATIYVRDIAEAAEALELRPVEAGANVALAACTYDVVFDRSEKIDGLNVAATSQIAVDMLTGPGRNPSEAVALLDWMERNESAWRR